MDDSAHPAASCTADFVAQCAIAKAELAQLQLLLNDAIAKLLASFSSIQQIHHQSRLPREHGHQVNAPVKAGAAGDASQDINVQVEEAVTALQFQDIATQLLGHLAMRLDHMELAMTQLYVTVERLSRGDIQGGGEPLPSLPLILKQAQEMAAKKKVKQHGMQEGEIELF